MNLLLALLAAVTLLVRTDAGEFVVEVDIDRAPLTAQGFAAFGRVVRGMEVVERVHRAPNTDAQRLTPPVRIISIARVPSP